MRTLILAVVVFLAAGSRRVASAAYIVRNGRPEAQIVVDAAPPRTTRLAAQQLQHYIEKLSGAALPITDEPDGDMPTSIFVGRSAYTDRVGVEPYDDKDGGYRIVSGGNWLALIGRDDDFVPVEPWPRNHGHWISGEVHEAWDALTGARWGHPLAGFHKRYSGRTWAFDPTVAPWTNKSAQVEVWAYDEQGSFNAVCDFLRRLGVRWYMPGELGEVVPRQSSIVLPTLDETVRPDFSLRRVNWGASFSDRDVALWAMHLGLRNPYDVMIAHGMATLVEREEFLTAHPDYFALYRGKRNNHPDSRYHQPCLSSPGLLRENVRFAQVLFDHYQYDAVSIMPPDAFGAICECPACEGKDTPERGYRGRLSDYVWDYVNRAAGELARTHPDRKVICCAYGSYTLPPLTIKKLRPNVQVCIVGGRRPMSSTPEQREAVRELRESWLPKTDNKILVFENYPFTGRGFYLPAYCARSIGESINATKGISDGEDIWFSPGHHLHAPGYNHFQIYFTARMYWGGKRDVGAMLDEYCHQFYGPAGAAMKAFFEYCEPNWQEMDEDKDKAARALDLFAAAADVVDPASVYGRRIAVVSEYLGGLRSKSRQLAMERGPVPAFRLGRYASGIVIDGKADDAYWQELPNYAWGRLRELNTGREPVFLTSFKAAWGRDALYFYIRCEDRPGMPLNVATDEDDDAALWDGDAVALFFETDVHSYYQIAVNPVGAVADVDCSGSGEGQLDWDAQVEVATEVGDGYWGVEIRIPVAEDTNDPLHNVAGRKPTESLPWYFNLYRQRVRDRGTERSAFSPTSSDDVHVPRRFGKLYVR